MSRNGVLCALAQAIPNSPTRAAGLSISVVAWDRMWTYRRPFSDYHPVGTSFSHFVFAAAMQGTLTLDNDLLAVFKVFGLNCIGCQSHFNECSKRKTTDAGSGKAQ